MKDHSRTRAPTLRLVTDGHAPSESDGEGLMTFRLELRLRDKVKHIAHVRHTTVRRLMTKAVKQIVAEFEASTAAGREVERDD